MEDVASAPTPTVTVEAFSSREHDAARTAVKMATKRTRRDINAPPVATADKEPDAREIVPLPPLYARWPQRSRWLVDNRGERSPDPRNAKSAGNDARLADLVTAFGGDEVRFQFRDLVQKALEELIDAELSESNGDQPDLCGSQCAISHLGSGKSPQRRTPCCSCRSSPGNGPRTSVRSLEPALINLSRHPGRVPHDNRVRRNVSRDHRACAHNGIPPNRHVR